MAAARSQIPSYRKRSGYCQALVTLTDSASGKRRDYWLGEHGSVESRELYHRLLAQWEAGGRRLPEASKVTAVPAAAYWPEAAHPSPVASGECVPAPGPRAAAETLAPVHTPTARPRPSVGELVRDYWRFAREYYTPSAASGIKSALRVVRECYASADAAAFGPNALRIVRDAMVLGGATGERPRPAWCRKTVNTRVGHVIRMFRWAASRELVPPHVYQALQTLPALKRGRTSAPDHEPVTPVSHEMVEAVKPFLSRQVAALIDLQLLSGARPGELLGIRTCDIETKGPSGVWVYRPRQHKNAHRQIQRSIYFGPRAQAILSAFMADRPTDAPLFSPAEADLERRARRHAERTAPLSCGNRPGSNLRDAPAKAPGDRYTTASYRRAIERACDLAFPPPEHLRPGEVVAGTRGPKTRRETELELQTRLTPRERAELTAWREEHRWHPNQLRHSAATEIRREFGLEAAQLVLGHSSAVITDSVYAARDEARVAEVIRCIG